MDTDKPAEMEDFRDGLMKRTQHFLLAGGKCALTIHSLRPCLFFALTGVSILHQLVTDLHIARVLGVGGDL